jgi:hypothetical protein
MVEHATYRISSVDRIRRASLKVSFDNGQSLNVHPADVRRRLLRRQRGRDVAVDLEDGQVFRIYDERRVKKIYPYDPLLEQGSLFGGLYYFIKGFVKKD